MKSRYFRYGWLLVIALATSSLYLPFLNNATVFDDLGLFSSLSVYDYAWTPFDFQRRTFPYFTLGLVQVVSGSIEVNRLFSLLVHIACTGMLLVLLKSFLEDVSNKSVSPIHQAQYSTRIWIVAAVSTAWFALNPLATYGAAYLVQRTILFATLFSLMSLWYFRRALVRNRMIDVVMAAFFYSAAVYSKEHAIMLPLGATAFAALYEGNARLRLKKICLYVLLCAPAALGVLLATKDVIATGYEPRAAAILALMHGIPLVDTRWGQWLVSIVFQTGFFFRYIGLWLVPDVRLLSVDMRFDFAHIWFAWWTVPLLFVFFLAPAFAAYFLRRKGLTALFCCGFLYCWCLFLTELVSIRFQEPFVLYRSYLWAPGYALMLAALLYPVKTRLLLACSVPVFVLFIFLGRDRLSSLASESALWKDAAAKLESPSLPGSDRIFYNRGMGYLKEKRFKDAAEDFTRAIHQSPTISSLYYERGVAYYSLNEFDKAGNDFERSVALNTKHGGGYYGLGLVLEQRGCLKQAMQAYVQSETLGVKTAKLKIRDLEKKENESAKSLRKCPDTA
jgi:protein O-mannosyl-transferase